MNRAAAPVTSIEEMSLNRRWAAPKLPRLSFNHLAVSGCIAVPLPISLGGGGRVEAELSLPEGLRLCLWFWLWLWPWPSLWLWFWLLEVYWRFSNTRFLPPIGQPRTLPTGSPRISHTPPPSPEGRSFAGSLQSEATSRVYA